MTVNGCLGITISLMMLLLLFPGTRDFIVARDLVLKVLLNKRRESIFGLLI